MLFIFTVFVCPGPCARYNFPVGCWQYAQFARALHAWLSQCAVLKLLVFLLKKKSRLKVPSSYERRRVPEGRVAYIEMYGCRQKFTAAVTAVQQQIYFRAVVDVAGVAVTAAGT